MTLTPAQQSDALRNRLAPHMHDARQRTINGPPVTTVAGCPCGVGVGLAGLCLDCVRDRIAEIVGDAKANRYVAALNELADAQGELLEVSDESEVNL